MPKETSIMLRVSGETKQRVERAARAAGKSLTDFVLDGAIKAAAKVERTKPKRVLAGPCPTFFRALCQTARMGGAQSYRAVGQHFAGAIPSEIPYELDNDEWRRRIEELDGLLESGTDAEILAWFDKNLPRIIRFVPKRRRRSFIEGMRAHVEDQGNLTLQL